VWHQQTALTIVFLRGFEDWRFNDGIRLRYARRETRVVPPLVTFSVTVQVYSR
jgi:hypothetical protein